MTARISKHQAATRQLDTAINLFFSGGDLISVHTLAGAAHILFHDLIEHKCPGKSWESISASDNELPLGKFLKIAREAQNFFKHAKNDSNDTFILNEDDTEHLMFLAIQNLCILLDDGLLSNEASVFQLWFMAIHKYPLNEGDSHELFAGIDNMSRQGKINCGHKALNSLTATQYLA